MTNRQYLDKMIEECDEIIAKQKPVIRENAIYAGVLYALYLLLLAVELVGKVHGAALAALLPGFVAGLYAGRAVQASMKRHLAQEKRLTIELGIKLANIVIREGDLEIVETDDGKIGD